MVAPTNVSKVQRKLEGLNPLSHGCVMTAPLDAIKGSLFFFSKVGTERHRVTPGVTARHGELC